MQPSLAAAPWLDLGTGSGAVALGASLLPGFDGQVYAVDISRTAADWARLNVRRLGLDRHVQVRRPWMLEAARLDLNLHEGCAWQAVCKAECDCAFCGNVLIVHAHHDSCTRAWLQQHSCKVAGQQPLSLVRRCCRAPGLTLCYTSRDRWGSSSATRPT